MLFGDSASTGANDTLLGGPGNDILIGDGGIPGSGRVATGTDSIEGGAGEDLIITGLVAGLPGGFDWFAVQNEWLNGGSLAQRQAHILGTTPGGLNGTHKLVPGVNIINDGSPGEPAIDIVLAGDQSDWILWDEVNDQLVDPNVEDSLLDISLYL
jgi:hypothetical protein